MNVGERVIEALRLWKEGDRAFDEGNYTKSAAHYTRAMELARSLPKEEPFDLPAFLASCNAGLSGALGRLGKHRESLAAAEAALSFFDRFGELYPVEFGKWMMAIANKGAALASIGRLGEALLCFERAKRMLKNHGVEDAQWTALIDQNIRSVNRMMKPKRKQRSKWWKFWK